MNATPKKPLVATITATITAPADCSEHQFETWIMQEMCVIPTDTQHPLFLFDFKKHVKNLDIKIKN